MVEKLEKAGAHVFVPLIEDYDLTDLTAIRRLYGNARPDILVHLAAIVGGIGANRENPGLGWRPQVTFKELVHLMVDADIEEVERPRDAPHHEAV